jgi:AcrR family transcriptional regulator
MTASRSQRPTRSTSGRVRPRNAGATKQALLDAAQELFGQHGFDGTTIREISERAGVDHALIARYYGSKADLYIAALVAEVQGVQMPLAYEGLKDMAEGLVTRMDDHGLGPVMQALIRTDPTDPVHKAARAHVVRRLVDPVFAEMTRRTPGEARLRSELVVSALIGISLGRALGWFDELMVVPKEHLVDLVTGLLDNGSIKEVVAGSSPVG